MSTVWFDSWEEACRVAEDAETLRLRYFHAPG